MEVLSGDGARQTEDSAARGPPVSPPVSLVDRLPNAVANREVVAILEEQLEQALAGKTVGIGIAAIYSDRECATVAMDCPEPMLLLATAQLLCDRISSEIRKLTDYSTGPSDPAGGGAA
jgi:hypothetical protein